MHETGGAAGDTRRWSPLGRGGAFTEHVGPFFETYDALEPNEPLRLGFRVAAHHCGGPGACHGGLLATALDLCLSLAMIAHEGIIGDPGFTPTISMGMEYLAPALEGAWIESRVRLVKTTGRMCFLDALLVVDAQPVLRGNGVYRRPAKR